MKINKKDSIIYQSVEVIPEDFCYLFVGHWMNGDFGEDRKNVGLLIKAFFELFKNKKNTPSLILKTSSGSSSYVDRERILKSIDLIRETVNAKTLPNIYLFHGDISDEEMNELYNHPKVKAMVNLTKGEGFGRPLLEFSLMQKPIITTNWSGHIDFLSKEFSVLCGGEMKNVHPSAANNWLLKESQWFNINQGELGFYLKDVFENYKNYIDRAKRQTYRSKMNFSYKNMTELLNSYFTTYLPEFPKVIPLKLPDNLKKINLPPKIKK
jgi:hypothetical protein